MILRQLRHDTAGATAVITALALSIIIGLAALGSEAAVWYVGKRTMQGAADSAAFSAGTSVMEGVTSSTIITAQAKSVAANYGYVDGANSVTVTVNKPPLSGGYTTNASAVEVIVQKPQGVLLATQYAPSSLTIASRAVALSGYVGNGCVVALDKANIADVTDIGNSTLNLAGCSLYIDSPNSSALTLNGSAQITADAAYISGNVNNPSKITTTNGLHTGVPPIADPYAGVPMPTAGACDYTNYAAPGGTTSIANPGGGTKTFCNGLTINSGSTVAFDPGTYVISGGTFKINGGATVTGTGVTFVLTGSGSDYAQMDIEGGANVTITAPTTGPTAGLAFMQDRNAPVISGSNTNKFTGGSTQSITGAIYFPEQNVTFSGNASSGGAICTQVIGLTLNFNGTSNFNNNCTGVGTKKIGSIPTVLVE